MASYRSFIGSELMQIRQNIAALRNMIPGSVKLKPTERRSMFKLNIKREVFVEQAIQQMRRNPSTVPTYVDITVCNTYLHLYSQYNELIKDVAEIITKLEDAKLLIGNEILQQTRAYYHNAKNASVAGISHFEEIYQSLKPHYAVGRNSKTN